MMERQFYRFSDLVALGIIRNRVTLARWVRDRGFPPGRLIGPNTRVYDRGDVEAWLAARPSRRETNSEAAA